MKKIKIFIIGNTSEKFHIGSIMFRAAKELSLDIVLANLNLNIYAPSMNYSYGKAFFKLAKKRPIEWWYFNDSILKSIENFCPDLILVTGIFPLQKKVFNKCKQLGVKIVNFLTDSPWSKQNSHAIFITNLNKYDCIFSTKKALIPDLNQVGVKQAHFLPFAFDPFLHYCSPIVEVESSSSQNPEVCLVGGADTERINFIKNFLKYFHSELVLYGSYWNKDSQLKQYYRGVIFDDAYRRTIRESVINIGIVRRANRDGHSMRSYEIPACGGLGIYEDTAEHRDLFSGYPEYGFFNSPDDLAEKCNWLLEHPLEREEMRQLGIQVVVKNTNTYTNRLEKILELVNI